MKNLIHLSDFTKTEIMEIFSIADRNKTSNVLKNKTAVMFFPDSSIRTRVTFEKAVYELGGHSILFPPEALDKKEDLRDLCGYLENWADIVIVRHNDINTVERLGKYLNIPVINAMTKKNHPCEILTDLYSLSKIRQDYINDNYLFVGANGNIGNTWKTASDIFGFAFSQCCPEGQEIEGAAVYHKLANAVVGKDIICTDSIPAALQSQFRDFQVTKNIMEKANLGAILNPCPPFYRGEEVSADVVDSEYFVGYGFKKHLLSVQKAIIEFCLG